LEQPWIWLVLTETWCGDAAPVLPIMDAFASHTDLLDLRIALRDEHQDLMDLFLTNNARSAQMVAAYREEHGKLTEELRMSLQKWYNTDRGESIIRELSGLLALE
jgi:hypothetical protein